MSAFVATVISRLLGYLESWNPFGICAAEFDFNMHALLIDQILLSSSKTFSFFSPVKLLHNSIDHLLPYGN
jgi:hypothetical protein